MSRAIRFYKTGGPEVLVWEEVEVGKPGPGEARVRHVAVGVNFIDIYIRRGLYPATLPSGVGTEAAGRVEEIGPGVTEVKVGDRVAYTGGPLGAYSEERVMPAHRLVVLPDGISEIQAAAMMLKGLTAQYLIRQIFKVMHGDTILFHAAAGGVGLIACQWAKSLGAIVIGTVGSELKAQIAKAHGCDHPIVYTHEDFVAAVTRRSHDLRAEGLAILHATEFSIPMRRSVAICGDGRGSIRRRALGCSEDRDQPEPSVKRRRAGTSRPGIAKDCRLDRVDRLGPNRNRRWQVVGLLVSD